MKLHILASTLVLAGFIGTATSAAVVGVTEGVRGLVKDTTAVGSTDASANPAFAFDLDTLGSLGADTFEVYGRIVDSIDNFAFSASGSFSVNWIFGGYVLDQGNTAVSASGFVSEGVAEKWSTFRLLDADNGFSVVDSLRVQTDVTSGIEQIFTAGAGNYVLQVAGSGENASGSGVGLYDIEIAAVPLPASVLMLLAGLAGLGAVSRRKSSV